MLAIANLMNNSNINSKIHIYIYIYIHIPEFRSLKAYNEDFFNDLYIYVVDINVNVFTNIIF